MKTARLLLCSTLAVAAMLLLTSIHAQAASPNYIGSHANIGGTFFPGGGPADEQSYVVVPWRTDGPSNTFSISDASLERYYGTAGYALFGTTFTYPDAGLYGGDAEIDPNDPGPLFENLIDLPAWVDNSQILAERAAGGYDFSLIDDPALTAGYRDNNWGDTQVPAASPEHTQPPYTKMGFLDGFDTFGNHPASAITGRWAFTVGEDVPEGFRLGVMTGGMDNANFAPGEVFLQQFSGTVPIDPNNIPTPVGNPQGTGTLEGGLRDRFVDMHFFDIINAEAGDIFVIGVTSGLDSFGNAGVAGFSFDVLTELPADNADFDGDGDVSGADFLRWQIGRGTANSQSEGDANYTGIIDSDDLDIWKSQYETPSLAAASTSVPEPASVLLLLSIVPFLGRRFRS